MKYPVQVSLEPERGCGYRKSGPEGVGIYLVGSPFSEVCERLPFALECCPTCGCGISFSRGFKWIMPEQLFAESRAPLCSRLASRSHKHELCAMCTPPADRHGLMWVGEQFYSPASFIAEANRVGVSKKIAAIPKRFVPGKSLIYLAHIKAAELEIEDGTELYPRAEKVPGVFCVFKPRIELVIDNAEKVPERARHIYERYGAANTRIVVVKPAGEESDQQDTEWKEIPESKRKTA